MYKLIPQDVGRDHDLPIRFRSKEDPVKALRSEIKQLKKHEKLFDEFGIMRKVLATVCAALAFSIGYCTYRTYLYQGNRLRDQNEIYLDESKGGTFVPGVITSQSPNVY